jgi:hypothetical protein
MSNSVTNYGTLLKAETYYGSGTFSVCAEVTNITPPELMNPPIEVTHHQSGGFREFIPGVLKEIKEFTVDLNYIATGTAAAPWSATNFYQDWASGYKRGYQIDFPVGAQAPTGTYAPPTWQFNALVTNIKPNGAKASSPEAQGITVTMKPTDSFLLV